MTANRKFFMHAVIVFCFMFLFRYIPPIGPITAYGMQIIGIFLGCLWGWVAADDLVWPSILGWIALGLTTDYTTVPKAIASVFSNSTVLLIIALLLLTAVINSCGLTKNISYALVNAKFAKGKPWVLTFMILMAAFWSSALVSSVAGTLICFEFVYVISRQIGYQPRDAWPSMMLVGVAFCACIAGSLMPYRPGVVACYGFLTAANPALSYNFGEYFIFALIFCLICIILYMLVCVLIIKPDISKFTDNKFELEKLPPLTDKQKFTTGMLIALVLVLIVPSLLPSNWVIVQILNGIGTTGLVFAGVGIAFIAKNKEGKNYYTVRDIAPSFGWDLVFMIGTALLIGPALSADGVGIKELFISILTPLCNGQGAFLFTFVFVVGILVGTNFINNAVMTAIFMPILAVIYMEIGVNPIAVTALVALAANIAILLPSASPVGALLASSKEWVSMKTILYQATLCMIVGAVAIAICIPIANVIMTM